LTGKLTTFDDLENTLPRDSVNFAQKPRRLLWMRVEWDANGVGPVVGFADTLPDFFKGQMPIFGAKPHHVRQAKIGNSDFGVSFSVFVVTHLP
jgi:hypothetical protein